MQFFFKENVEILLIAIMLMLMMNQEILLVIVLINYNFQTLINLKKNLLECAQTIFDQFRKIEQIHNDIQDMLDEAQLLIFLKEIEQTTLKMIEIISLPDLTLDEREQHQEIQSKIKESFEIPSVQFVNTSKYPSEDIEK